MWPQAVCFTAATYHWDEVRVNNSTLIAPCLLPTVGVGFFELLSLIFPNLKQLKIKISFWMDPVTSLFWQLLFSEVKNDTSILISKQTWIRSP